MCLSLSKEHVPNHSKAPFCYLFQLASNSWSYCLSLLSAGLEMYAAMPDYHTVLLYLLHERHFLVFKCLWALLPHASQYASPCALPCSLLKLTPVQEAVAGPLVRTQQEGNRVLRRSPSAWVWIDTWLTRTCARFPFTSLPRLFLRKQNRNRWTWACSLLHTHVIQERCLCGYKPCYGVTHKWRTMESTQRFPCWVSHVPSGMRLQIPKVPHRVCDNYMVRGI